MDPLNARAWRALLRVLIVMSLLLFLSAGTVRYWQAWLYLLTFVGSAILVTVDLMRRDRALLERRLQAGASAEAGSTQRLILRPSAVAFAALLIISALEHRLQNSPAPFAAIGAGHLLVVLGFTIVGRVYRENSFASATVGVVATQQVVTTGPYAVVRHPMYLGVACCLAGTPLALSSLWGALPAACLVGLLIWRLLDEERVLVKELAGYAQYQQQVPYRLVPYAW